MAEVRALLFLVSRRLCISIPVQQVRNATIETEASNRKRVSLNAILDNMSSPRRVKSIFPTRAFQDI